MFRECTCGYWTEQAVFDFGEAIVHGAWEAGVLQQEAQHFIAAYPDLHVTPVHQLNGERVDNALPKSTASACCRAHR